MIVLSELKSRKKIVKNVSEQTKNSIFAVRILKKQRNQINIPNVLLAYTYRYEQNVFLSWKKKK